MCYITLPIVWCVKQKKYVGRLTQKKCVKLNSAVDDDDYRKNDERWAFQLSLKYVLQMLLGNNYVLVAFLFMNPFFHFI